MRGDTPAEGVPLRREHPDDDAAAAAGTGVRRSLSNTKRSALSDLGKRARARKL
jgi:hypothetical protein